MQKQKADERKARTKRLIERGAILESLVYGADTFTNEQIKSFLEKTVQGETARKILDGMTNQGGETATAKAPETAKNSSVSVNGKTADAAQGAD